MSWRTNDPCLSVGCEKRAPPPQAWPHRGYLHAPMMKIANRYANGEKEDKIMKGEPRNKPIGYKNDENNPTKHTTGECMALKRIGLKKENNLLTTMMVVVVVMMLRIIQTNTRRRVCF